MWTWTKYAVVRLCTLEPFQIQHYKPAVVQYKFTNELDDFLTTSRHKKHVHEQLHNRRWVKDASNVSVSQCKVLCVVIFYCRNYGLYKLQKDHQISVPAIIKKQLDEITHNEEVNNICLTTYVLPQLQAWMHQGLPVRRYFLRIVTVLVKCPYQQCKLRPTHTDKLRWTESWRL